MWAYPHGSGEALALAKRAKAVPLEAGHSIVNKLFSNCTQINCFQITNNILLVKNYFLFVIKSIKLWGNFMLLLRLREQVFKIVIYYTLVKKQKVSI